LWPNKSNEVNPRDHLLVLVDEVLGGGDPNLGGGRGKDSATGLADVDGKVGYVEASTGDEEHTALHELGHMLGLNMWQMEQKI
jgi:hypothetical protein